MIGAKGVNFSVGFLVHTHTHTHINVSSNSTERIFGFCEGFSESQMETPSTTSKDNPSGSMQRKK